MFLFNLLADLLPERAKLLRKALANLTAQHRPGIVLAHHPMNYIAARQMTLPYPKALSARNIKYSMHISGHTHIENYARYPAGTLELTARASFVCEDHQSAQKFCPSASSLWWYNRLVTSVCGRSTTTF